MIVGFADQPYLELAARPFDATQRNEQFRDDRRLPMQRDEHRVDRQLGLIRLGETPEPQRPGEADGGKPQNDAGQEEERERRVKRQTGRHGIDRKRYRDGDSEAAEKGALPGVGDDERREGLQTIEQSQCRDPRQFALRLCRKGLAQDRRGDNPHTPGDRRPLRQKRFHLCQAQGRRCAKQRRRFARNVELHGPGLFACPQKKNAIPVADQQPARIYRMLEREPELAGNRPEKPVFGKNAGCKKLTQEARFADAGPLGDGRDIPTGDEKLFEQTPPLAQLRIVGNVRRTGVAGRFP